MNVSIGESRGTFHMMQTITHHHSASPDAE
jgi:hypothetical protein